MDKVGVVHLVRRKNGLEPFERFLASYRTYPAGIPHDLILIFKGFPKGGKTQDYDRLLVDVPHRRIYLADFGFDLRPYFKAVAMLEHHHLCFINSFSRILAQDWLIKLYRCATAEGVGVVGATASYQSFSSDSADRKRMLRIMSLNKRLGWQIRHIFNDRHPRLILQRAAAWFLGVLRIWSPARYFPLFPNYHVRTNAFMASREVLARVSIGPMFFKLSAYMFESGHDGMTQQIMKFGLRPLVVGRDGVSYEKEDWPNANTFWQGRQENLLISDNQTEAYDNADIERRAELSKFAWGSFARPQRN